MILEGHTPDIFTFNTSMYLPPRYVKWVRQKMVFLRDNIIKALETNHMTPFPNQMSVISMCRGPFFIQNPYFCYSFIACFLFSCMVGFCFPGEPPKGTNDL